MGDDGLKEDIGEAVPLSTTARLLTSKRGADRSLDRNVLVQIMLIGEQDFYRRHRRKETGHGRNGIWLETHSLARLSIEGFVGDAVREAPGHSRAQYKRADRQSERCEEIDMHVHAGGSKRAQRNNRLWTRLGRGARRVDLQARCESCL